MAGMAGMENYDVTAGPGAAAPPNGKPRPVDVREIEDAISQLHVEHRDTGARTYILNMLVFASGDANRELAHAIGAQVCLNYPSRAIVMEVNPSGDAVLEAAVAAQSDFADAAITMSSEQITLRAVGDAVGQLPTVITPLLIPEIPVALCCLGDVPFGLPVFDSIMNTVDQLIVDSAQFSHPVAMVERMDAVAGDQWSSVTFNDLTWTRLLPWREATAQFFDTPATRPALDAIQRLSVTFAAAPGAETNPIKALLYSGWLASRLGWEAVRDLRRVGRDTMLVMRHGEIPVIVECNARNTDAVPNGDLLTATITADPGDGVMIFHLDRSEELHSFRATITHEGQTTDERTLPREERGPGDIVCDLVGSVRRDAIYEQALHLVVRLVGSGMTER